MATEPPPDFIEPVSPPETPATPTPSEAPFNEPPEIAPQQPDYDDPAPGGPETPAPDL